MRKFGVIMAGGSGTRFWPLSRQKTPKQLLNLTGRDLMVNEAIDRLSYTVDREDIFIVTNVSQAEAMRRATKGRIRPDHILSEPEARNTAACIGYAAMEIAVKYGGGLMIVTPSDAYIRDNAEFTRVLAQAAEAAKTKDKLVTVGITPTFAATGYGYIRYDKGQPGQVKDVLEFREKPDEKTAESYLRSGEYVWNSGMFIWKTETILKKFEQLAPDIYRDLKKIGDALGSGEQEAVMEAVYPGIRKISVDYAIMEPCASSGDVAVVPGDFGWNDVASWDMMGVLRSADENGNILSGDAVALDVKDSVVYSGGGRLVAALGVENLVVVETPDAVLVCSKDRAQDVKLIVEELIARGRKELC